MDSEKEFAAPNLTDDLVVEILSRVPFKSFCLFKCVCKAWLAFSSDPHYRKKLLKITGLLQGRGSDDNSAIQLVSLSPNDGEIDAALTFMPGYKHLDLVDCCNGLVLCKYRNRYTPINIRRFIVCNPATREWRMLPDRQPHPDSEPDGIYDKDVLAFDPSWSPHFYVFNFHEDQISGVNQVEVFSSELSRWFVDEDWNSDILIFDKQNLFVGGLLHLLIHGHEILVVEDLKAISSGLRPRHFTVELPPDDWVDSSVGCFSQCSGTFHYAIPERDGVLVWSLDAYHPCEWSMKYRLSMRDVLGTGDFLHYFSEGGLWYRVYQIAALDSERKFLLLLDNKAERLCSYNINTGKHTEVQDGYLRCGYRYYYVACYSKLQA